MKMFLFKVLSALPVILFILTALGIVLPDFSSLIFEVNANGGGL